MKIGTLIAFALGLAASAVSPALAQDACAAGKTLTPGKLTIATSEPAYFPWVIDNKPQSGKGFEAAVAYAIAKAMGFKSDQVDWTRASFDASIQPGAKNFDLNFQQFTITPARAKNITFSAPYYTAATAVVMRKSIIAKDGVKPNVASLTKLHWGAPAGTTAIAMLKDVIHPASSPLIYNDTADMVQALKSNQIDAILVDLPTALYITAVELNDGVTVGQFAGTAKGTPDQFGAVMQKDSPLKPCVDAAIAAITKDGTLKALETKWLEQATYVPVIKQ